ncbi:hypothetical protein ACFV4N_08755 [Actinosynnema sp. NPDC059797]
MSEGTGAGPRTSLFDHASCLHERHPDGPLPDYGEPFPNDPPPSRARRDARTDLRRDGADVAAVLDGHFAGDGHPSELAGALSGLAVPIHRNDHVAAAALRADRERVRRTGRWLVRHGAGQAEVLVGLALLGTDWRDDEDEIALIRMIGLLSRTFGPLAAAALERRRHGEDALLWLGDRVDGWGRVHVVEALCRRAGERSRRWLRRRACDGDVLNSYFAGRVATVAHLHHAITTESDDELVDHTGRLPAVLGHASGMGMDLGRYPPARQVVEAHVAHLARQGPTRDRFAAAVCLAGLLAGPGAVAGATREQRTRLVGRYRAVLDRDEWCRVLDDAEDRWAWLRGTGVALGLRAFAGAG